MSAQPKTWADQVTERYFQEIKDVTAEELAALPPRVKEEKKERYLCYFLRSQKAPNRTYSGSTNDFPHRIRQHNGIIVGGAKMTESTRPWRVACLVLGFPDHSSALRFEFFTKTRNTKIDGAGLNALQRRAALIAAAERKMISSVRQGLSFHLPDPYFRECVEVARNKLGPLLRMFQGDACRELVVPEWHSTQGNVLSVSKAKKEDNVTCFVQI
jgi:predicted GIY-YIG superfamily endonuclease